MIIVIVIIIITIIFVIIFGLSWLWLNPRVSETTRSLRAKLFSLGLQTAASQASRSLQRTDGSSKKIQKDGEVE
jgi:uncharacterized membrane protein affecting hemolysin expression